MDENENWARISKRSLRDRNLGPRLKMKLRDIRQTGDLFKQLLLGLLLMNAILV